MAIFKTIRQSSCKPEKPKLNKKTASEYGLLKYYNFGSERKPFDLIENKSVTNISVAKLSAVKRETVFDCKTNAGHFYDTDDSYKSKITNKITMFVELDHISTTGNSTFVFGNVGAASIGYNAGIYWHATSGRYLFFVKTGGSATSTTATLSPLASGKQLIICTYDGVNLRIYESTNGVVTLADTVAKTGNVDQTDLEICFNRWVAGSQVRSKYFQAGIADKAWSQKEIESFAKNKNLFLALNPDYFYIAGGDTAAPVISNATASATGSTTATGTFDTDEVAGTGYAWATANATEIAGDIIASGNSATVSTTTTTILHTGLTASTTYYIHYVQNDAAGNTSNVISGASFTTDAASTFQVAWATRARASRMIGAR